VLICAVNLSQPKEGRATAIVLDVVRHALPLIPLYFWRGSITSYLLLTAFDLSLGLMLIVGTTRERSDPTTVDPRATWLASRLTAVLVLAIFFGIVAAIISVPIGMPAVIFGLATAGELPALFSRPSFWIAAAAMALATGARAQHSFETVTTPGERGTSPHAAPVIGDFEGDRRRSKAANAAQVTIIATYVALSYLLSNFGQRGFFIFPMLFAALLIFYDARPDLAQRIFPTLWREKKTQPAKTKGANQKRRA
jgi:hypothetical protein